jgi:preprotein translocase subunit SecG
MTYPKNFIIRCPDLKKEKNMIQTLMILQLIVSILLIIMVLLQFGKGAEAGLISGGASDAVFSGSQKGNILSKITILLSILFLGGSINLARLQGQRANKSILDQEAPIALPLNDESSEKVEELEGNTNPEDSIKDVKAPSDSQPSSENSTK